MTWPHGDPDAIVRAVLLQPVYATRVTSQAAPQASLWELAWRWFAQHVLAPLVAPLERIAGAAHGAGAVVGAVLALCALLALGVVAFRLLLAFARHPATGVSRVATADGGSLAELRDSAAWRAAADAAARRGEYARAIGALFSAALAALDERALVVFDAARAPREYRRLVRQRKTAAAAPFDDLTERFVRATYAAAAPQRADFDAADRAYAAFEPALRA